MGVKLKDAYAKTAAHADTVKQGIDAATTSRVLATFFGVLDGHSTEEVVGLIQQGLAKAKTAKAKAVAAAKAAKEAKKAEKAAKAAV